MPTRIYKLLSDIHSLIINLHYNQELFSLLETAGRSVFGGIGNAPRRPGSDAIG